MVKVFGRRPAQVARLGTGAGVRKPPMHEPAATSAMLWGFEDSAAPVQVAQRAQSVAVRRRRVGRTVCERAIDPTR